MNTSAVAIEICYDQNLASSPPQLNYSPAYSFEKLAIKRVLISLLILHNNKFYKTHTVWIKQSILCAKHHQNNTQTKHADKLL